MILSQQFPQKSLHSVIKYAIICI